jgi:large subunit ribosomal protein L21e
MRKRKPLREHGKIRLSRYFEEFDDGTKVAVVMEHSLEPKFPMQIQGRTGIIVGKRGNSYIIKMNDLNKEKTYIIHPAHLKKIKSK